MTKTRNRILLSTLVAVCIGTSSTLQGLPLPTVETPVDPIETSGGLVAGKVLPSGVNAWLAVPYAQAPIRELRWKPPQAISWSGVYNADRYAPNCMQDLRGSNINHYFGNEATSEDCLYLNIWAPSDAAEGERPVVVWIYGGGLRVGSSAMRNYSGESLAQKGAVYVSMNYRLGVLGFLAHPELTAESPHGASGNYGMLDQVAALEWVRDNISRFGGDPDNVTIMGQSGGGRSVVSLQISPLAKGLFHRAVSMSGIVAPYPPTREEAEQEGLALQSALGANSLQELRYIPPDVIHDVQGDYFSGLIVDGHYFPEAPAEIFAKGEQSDVPLIVGNTSDDGGGALQRATTLDAYVQTVNELYGDKASEFLGLFPADTDAEARVAARAAAVLSGRAGNAYNWAVAQYTYGDAPVYAYQFSRTQPYTPGVVFDDHNPATAGAYHTADVPYWLQTLDSLNLFRETRTWTRFDRQLADIMSDAILNFAVSGDPSHGELEWPEFDPDNKLIVNFGSGEELSEVERWPYIDNLYFFEQNAAQPTPPIVRQARD
jgi:para-nitrobenzyl esterase